MRTARNWRRETWERNCKEGGCLSHALNSSLLRLNITLQWNIKFILKNNKITNISSPGCWAHKSKHTICETKLFIYIRQQRYRCFTFQCMCGYLVYQISTSNNCLTSKFFWNISLKQKTPNHFKEMTVLPFCHSILLSTAVRRFMYDPFSIKVLLNMIWHILWNCQSIYLNMSIELCLYKFNKL